VSGQASKPDLLNVALDHDEHCPEAALLLGGLAAAPFGEDGADPPAAGVADELFPVF
jgi:hypothetical protein